MIKRIVVAHPPMFDKIDKAFNVRGKPVIFAWVETIFNPTNGLITPELIAHEGVHGERQITITRTPEEWWERYIADPDFRLAEEIPAHIAQYRRYCSRFADRNKRIAYLNEVAAALSSSTYGNLISLEDARMAIRA